MDLQLLEHRVRVTSIDKSGLWFFTHSIVKLLFLRHRTRCKFFSLTETPEDYTLMLDEEGFEGKVTLVLHNTGCIRSWV
ncbi:hypothetical protein GDO81_001993 [Engystomops pustulosus]|uniref:CASTOR1 N-terminal domain-containing protein n=1 Tax=Engystomops pustulosus TaxID=76066 RepID=A0AAV7DGK9_ENGPU|nr:hypothetical protein GDO81_001993 [Engystomops pustulosus]